MIAVVDSGTTRTRVRLWDGKSVVWGQSQLAGARDTAADGHPSKVKAALKEMLSGTEGLEAVLCSGMITSNAGLLEVPHLPAPCSPQDTAGAIVRHDFPEISPAPFFFIPGIKTMPQNLGLENLDLADVMRGEETEVLGLRELLGLPGAALLMHYGSHHKAIQLGADGEILGSKTGLTGELLAAITGHTILKGSTSDLQTLNVDLEAWRAGLKAALEHGVSRALFLVRVGEQLANLSKTETTSYLLGVLTSLDLVLLKSAVQNRENIVLYGGGHFPPLMKAYLDENQTPAQLVSPEVAENAAVVGAVRLFRLYVQLQAGRA